MGNVLAVFTAMVCCIDRIFCETILKIGNALAALVGLFLIACGLYLEFGPVDASSKLLEFLKLQNIEQVYNVVARFQIWVIVLGAVIFVLALFTFFCTGSNLAKVYYCIYSPVLMLLSLLIFFAVGVLYVAAKSTESNDYQKISILGYSLTDKFQALWVKGVVQDTETICELEEVVQCSGFYDAQCIVPPTGSVTQQEVITHCPAQYQIFEGTGSIQSPSTISNDTLQDISKDVGWNVSKCLYYETENVNYGCLRTLAMILYQVGTVLFIPGLVIASYILLLSLASSYLTCCALCGKI